MKIYTKSLCTTLLIFIIAFTSAKAATPPREYYEISIYHTANEQQFQVVNAYLQHTFIPFMNKLGVQHIGVFTPVTPDSADHKIYVLVPFISLQQWKSSYAKLYANTAFQKAAGEYWNAPADTPPYTRMEKIILWAFPDMPALQVPHLNSPRTERIYELRSYESPDEKFGFNKITMFNDGGEVGIFKKIHANAVFYGQVLAGSHMPNLMYMTTYENMDDRNAHWKAFGSDPLWQKISHMDKYQKNVSKVDDTFLHATDYSEL